MGFEKHANDAKRGMGQAVRSLGKPQYLTRAATAVSFKCKSARAAHSRPSADHLVRAQFPQESLSSAQSRACQAGDLVHFSFRPSRGLLTLLAHQRACSVSSPAASGGRGVLPGAACCEPVALPSNTPSTCHAGAKVCVCLASYSNLLRALPRRRRGLKSMRFGSIGPFEWCAGIAILPRH